MPLVTLNDKEVAKFDPTSGINVNVNLAGTSVTLSVSQGTPASVANAWPIIVTDGTDSAEVEAAGTYSVGIAQANKGLTTNSRAHQFWPASGISGIAGDNNFYPQLMGNLGDIFTGIGSWITTSGSQRVSTNSGTVDAGTLRVVLPTNQPAVSVTLTSSVVDTELPAAAALADSTSNPTAPAVGAFTMGWNGSTWDRGMLSTLADLDSSGGTQNVVMVSPRMAASGGGVEVYKAEDAAHASGDAGQMALAVENTANTALSGSAGDYTPMGVDAEGSSRIIGNRAHDAVDSGAPIKIGGKARTANPTAVTALDRVDATFDDLGRQVVILNQVRDLVTQATTTITNSTTETTILAAGAAGVFHDLTCIVITNQTAAIPVTVTIKDATAGTTRMILDLGGNGADGSKVIVPVVPIIQSATAQNWTATLSVNTVVVDIFIQGVKNV